MGSASTKLLNSKENGGATLSFSGSTCKFCNSEDVKRFAELPMEDKARQNVDTFVTSFNLGPKIANEFKRIACCQSKEKTGNKKRNKMKGLVYYQKIL